MVRRFSAMAQEDIPSLARTVHAPKTIDEILAAQRYMRTQLREFELDQVTVPFAQTRKDQGLGRAIRGTLQRGALKALGVFYSGEDNDRRKIGPFELYVERMRNRIAQEREAERAFEAEHGTTFVRDLFQSIHDAPEESVPTYKAARRVFRKLERDLEVERAKRNPNPIAKAWRRAKAQLTYRDRELKWGAGLAAATLVSLCMIPTHRYYEWKDHHRFVNYVKYDPKTLDPMSTMAAAASNLEMYCHDTWNNSYGLPSASSVVDEFRYFIERNDYNARHPDNDSGSDHTKPRLQLFDVAFKAASEHVAPLAQPVGQIAAGLGDVDGSWSHSSINHYQTYSCGTSKQPRTCTRCTSTTHYFSLDANRLRRGIAEVDRGRGTFPDMPPAAPQASMLTVKDVPTIVRASGVEDTNEWLDERNQWAKSVFTDGYNEMLGAQASLRSSALPDQMVRDLPSYDRTFTTTTPFCGPALSHPRGWSEHERLAGMARAVVEPHNDIHSSLKKLHGARDELVASIARIEKETSNTEVVSDGLRDIADLGWRMHNANVRDDWHPTHWQQLLLELLATIAGSAILGFGGYALLDKYRDTRLVRKMYENDIEPELVDPYARGYDRWR